MRGFIGETVHYYFFAFDCWPYVLSIFEFVLLVIGRSRRLLKFHVLITTYDDLTRDYEELAEVFMTRFVFGFFLSIRVFCLKFFAIVACRCAARIFLPAQSPVFHSF